MKVLMTFIMSLGESNYLFPEDFHNICTNKQYDNFSTIHLNIRSLCNFCYALQIFLSSLYYNFDIIGITETWLNNNSPINMYNIDNYSLVQVFRSDRTGGGSHFM